MLQSRHLMWRVALLVFFIGFVIGSNKPATTPSSLSNNCVKKCFHELLKGREQSGYHQCMEECMGTWLLRNVGDCQSIDSLIEPDGPHTCTPSKLNISEIHVRDPKTELIVAYWRISWFPCDVGIEDLTGFYFTIIPRDVSFAIDCHKLELKRRLTLADAQTQFTIISLPRAEPASNYDITIRSLPAAREDPYTQRETSSSCQDLNPAVDGDSPCEASRAAPIVNVKGYTLEVSLLPVKPRFNPTFYSFSMAVGRDPSDREVRFESVRANKKDKKLITCSFNGVYDTNKIIIVKAAILLGRSGPYETRSSYVTVPAWVPPPPIVNIISQRQVEVSFRSAPEEFSIPAYHIRLSRLNGPKDSSPLSVEIVSERTAAPSDAKQALFLETYWDLKPGTYSVQVLKFMSILRKLEDKKTKLLLIIFNQIREKRPESKHFNPPKWGNSQSFELSVHSDLSLILGIAIPVFLCLTVFSIVVVLLSWKADKYHRVRYVLPTRVISWLDLQVSHFKTKSVLLVWQADFRSRSLYKLHSDNIRFLATYLSKVCGLDVIVDLFQENDVIESASSWMVTSCDRADFILFVCPHFPYASEVDTVNSILGDFESMFRFLEKSLEKKNNFSTVLLPYSRSKCSPSSITLSRMGRMFSLMDDISNLYFHIQGVPRADSRGKHSARFISRDDYMKTREGAALQRGLRDFQKALTSWDDKAHHLEVALPLENTGNDEIDSSNDGSDEALLAEGDLRINRLGITPPVSTCFRRPQEAVGDALTPSRIPNSAAPSSRHQKPKVVLPPPPLVSDPNTEIIRINDFSGSPPDSIPAEGKSHATSSNSSIELSVMSGINSSRSSPTFDISPEDTELESSNVLLNARSLIALEQKVFIPRKDLPHPMDDVSPSEDSGFESRIV